VRIRRIVYDQLLRDVTGAYTAASEFTRDSLTRFERIPRSRIRVIYNGVALGDQRPADREAAARQSLSLDPKGASC
jgi:hypothetical protein